jgi:ribosome-associated protein YbcJ (S4-like RNA binding protein)
MIVLNGEIETRKRKKLFKGDVVVFDDTQIKIV